MTQDDEWEEYSEMLRQGGFTGIHCIGDYQFTICRADGAWLQLAPERVPPDEFFTFDTTWLDRHAITAHDVRDWEGISEVPAEQHTSCGNGRRCRPGPHVWADFVDTEDGNDVTTRWMLCPGLKGRQPGYPARTSQRRDR